MISEFVISEDVISTTAVTVVVVEFSQIPQLIVGAFGMDFIMGVSFDLSPNTSLQFTFLKPDKTTLVVIAVQGTTDLTTTEGTFAADTWASYTFQDGDLDQVGTAAKGNPWSAVLDYFVGSTEKFSSSGESFDVSERGDAC